MNLKKGVCLKRPFYRIFHPSKIIRLVTIHYKLLKYYANDIRNEFWLIVRISGERFIDLHERVYFQFLVAKTGLHAYLRNSADDSRLKRKFCSTHLNFVTCLLILLFII